MHYISDRVLQISGVQTRKPKCEFQEEDNKLIGRRQRFLFHRHSSEVTNRNNDDWVVVAVWMSVCLCLCVLLLLLWNVGVISSNLLQRRFETRAMSVCMSYAMSGTEWPRLYCADVPLRNYSLCRPSPCACTRVFFPVSCFVRSVSTSSMSLILPLLFCGLELRIYCRYPLRILLSLCRPTLLSVYAAP